MVDLVDEIVAAHDNGVPFYVAAPVSSIDLSCRTGEQIPIEERAAAEVTHVGGKQIAPREHDRNCLRLNGSCFGITLLGDGAEQLGSEAEILK